MDDGSILGAHLDVRDVVGEVRHVVEHVPEVALGDLDVGGVREADGGGVAQGAEVRVRVARDPHARGRERQRRLGRLLRRRTLPVVVPQLLPLLLLLPILLPVVVIVGVLRRQDDVRRHGGGGGGGVRGCDRRKPRRRRGCRARGGMVPSFKLAGSY